MAEVTLERVTEQARVLTPEEQQQLRALLDSWLTPPTAHDLKQRERQFAEHLLEIGMLDHIPEGYPADYIPPPPIIVTGEPVSETIIRERR